MTAGIMPSMATRGRYKTENPDHEDVLTNGLVRLTQCINTQILSTDKTQRIEHKAIFAASCVSYYESKKAGSGLFFGGSLLKGSLKVRC